MARRVSLLAQSKFQDTMKTADIHSDPAKGPPRSCEGTGWRRVIERACVFRDVVSDETLRAIVGKISDVPSLPNVYWDLARAVGQGTASVAQVASILERDAPAAAKLLQLANSAH